MQALLPSCRTVVIPDQGHSVLVERHHALRGPLLDWIAELEPEWTPRTGDRTGSPGDRAGSRAS